MAGGGIKGGIAFGQNDEMGAKVAENEVHVRDFRLTDVAGNVVKDLLA